MARSRKPTLYLPGLIIRGLVPSMLGSMTGGQAEYVSITDSEAVEAFQLTTRLEGIICVGTSTCRRPCDEDRGDLPAGSSHGD